MKRLIIFLAVIPLCLNSFSQVETKLQKADALAKACISSKADIVADCLGEANELYISAYDEFVSKAMSATEIGELPYARMMFHVGCYKMQNFYFKDGIPYYDTAMSVYANADKLDNNDVWRCFEMLDVLKAYYSYDSVDYEKNLRYALLNADFTKKYLKKQYHELSSAMEEVAIAYINLSKYDEAEEAINEALKAEEKVGGKNSEHYYSIEQLRDVIAWEKDYQVSTYTPAVYRPIENPSNHRDSLCNKLVEVRYYIEEAMPLFEELQGLVEKEGMKNSADSLIYAKSLFIIAIQCFDESLSSADDENKALMLAKATRYMKQADEIYASSKDTISETYASILYELAIIYNNGRNDKETAMKYAEASIEVFKKLPSNEYCFSRCMDILGALDSYYCGDEMRDCEKAIRYNEQMIEMSRDINNGWYIYALFQAGNNNTKLGNYNKALEYYMLAYENNDNSTDGDAEILLKIADTYKALGDSKSEEKYRQLYEDAVAIENNTNYDDYYIPTSYMSISDFLTVAVDDDEVQLLYDGTFRPVKATRCDSLRYDAICAVMKRGAANPSERMNRTRPIMIAFQDYFEEGNASRTDSIYYAYSLHNVGSFICETSKGSSKGIKFLMKAKEIYEKLLLTETRNYANVLYELANSRSYVGSNEHYFLEAYQAYKKMPTNDFVHNRCLNILGILIDYYENTISSTEGFQYSESIKIWKETESYIGQQPEYFEKDELELLYIDISKQQAKLFSQMFEMDSSIFYYKQALSRMEKAKMKNTHTYCKTVKRLADNCRMNGNYADAKKYAKIYDKLSKKFIYDNDYDIPLDSDDMSFDDYDDYNYEWSVEDLLGESDLDYTTSQIDSLYYGTILTNQMFGIDVKYLGNYEETLEKMKDILYKDETKTSHDILIYAKTLFIVAYVENLAQKYDKSLQHYTELDSILLPFNSISSELSNIHFASMAYKINDYNFSLADSYFEAITNYYNYQSNEYLQLALNYAAQLYASIHDYDNAFKYCEYLMEIFKGNDYSLSYFENKILQASIYAEYGDYVSVVGCLEPEIERIEYMCAQLYIYIEAINLLGDAYVALGNYDKALQYYNLAQENLRYYGYTDVKELAKLGKLSDKLGKHKEAIDYYSDAVESIDDMIESDPYFYFDVGDYMDMYKSIGVSYYKLGRLDDAMSLLENGLSMYTENTIYYSQRADMLSSIALIYKEKADYDTALVKYNDALEIYRRVYDDSHPACAEILNGIGDVYFAKGDYAKAAENYSKAMEISRKHLAANFSFLTSAEREMYWDSNKSICQHIFQCGNKLPDNEVISEGTYNAELITKGLLLTSDIEFARSIYNSGDSLLVSSYSELVEKKDRLNMAYEMPIEDRYIDCKELKEEINAIERKLVANVEKYGGFNTSVGLTWKDVQSAMRNGDVAVEFARFDTDSEGTQYAALVLTKNMKSPVFVPLCSEKNLQRLLRTGVMPDKQSDERGASVLQDKRMGVYTSTDLYNTIWKPLEKYFGKNPRIYFAPTGILHQVAIEYAPVNSTKSVSDIYEIYRVSSTRFLAMNYSPRPFDEAVLYGGIRYDSDTTSMKHESERFGTRSTSYNSFADISREEDRASLSYLPGTKAEVENIEAKLKAGKVKVDMYVGKEANEESFKDLSGKKVSLLHIATHGFFVPADTILNSEQSLNLSGLLLAGANNIWTNQTVPEGVEDGVLTAKEISNMDLRNTDMVVLSACQTGLGEITDEGVFGLQRGFKKAGAHTIIMSLWSVDDDATQIMMTEFYTNLTKGMSKREAFLKAQRTLKATKGFENPRYWAAFIMLDGNEK